MAKTDAVPQKDKYDFTKLNTLSVVSLASALTGFGVVAAIITGHISLAQIKRTGQNGRPLALAGVILGYVSIGLWVLGGVAMLGLKYWLIKNGYDVDGDFGYRDMGPGMMWDKN